MSLPIIRALTTIKAPVIDSNTTEKSPRDTKNIIQNLLDRKSDLEEKMMTNRYIIVVFHILIYAAVTSLALEDYGISEECSCSFNKLPQDSSCVADPDCYPTHRNLGISSECLPSIPAK